MKSPVHIHMSPCAFAVLQTKTIGEIQDELPVHAKNDCLFDYVYALDAKGKLVGVLPLKKLFSCGRATELKKAMTKKVVSVTPHMDQEHVAILAIRHGIQTMPVVDRGGKLVGVVDAKHILRILHDEHVERMLRRSGIHGDQPHMLDTLHGRLRHIIRARMPWLIVGVVGSMAVAFLVSRFEATLERNIALAFFIPAVVYIADAVKNQTETLLIRSLSLEKFRVRRYVLREIFVVGIIALVCSILMFLFGLLWKREVSVALTVSLATFIGMISAIFTGMGIPWILSVFKKDPAVGSGPFATVIQDLVSIVIYFSVANVIMR